MIFKKAIPRRTFLKGVGTTLALPLLDSMFPAFAATTDLASRAATRLSTVFVPNGRIMKWWTPAIEGADFETTQTLEPLMPFRKQLLVLSGLDIKAADPVGNEPGGNHARPAGAFLTGIHPKPGGALGISLDQVVAKEFGKQTQLASLELGLDSKEIDDGSYAAYYTNTISWRGPTTPLPMEVNPRSVFEHLFGDSDTTDPAEQLRRVQKQQSILDSVTQGVSRMMGGLGTNDRGKLSEYLDAIRDIERRIQVAEKTPSSTEDPRSTTSQGVMERPTGIPTLFSEHCKLMFDLQVVAFQSDLTRVSTFMMGREQTDRAFPEIGIGDGHHPLSHHKEVPETVALVGQIDLFQSKMVAYYLDKLRSTPDGDGNLLDHSIVLFGSGLSDGNFHVHHDVPVVLAGGASGQLKGGRHIRYQGQPKSNLHLTLLDLLKVPAEGYLDSKFSDATGKLEGLNL